MMYRRLSCFVIMPYSEKSDHIFSGLIVPVLKELHGFDVLTLRADTMGRTEITLKAHVENAVRIADFCIADVSGSNPNVMYELGYAQAIKKPIVLIGESKNSSLPANVSELPFIGYSLDHLSEFKRHLNDACMNVANSISLLEKSSLNNGECEQVITASIDDNVLKRFLAATHNRLFVLVGSPQLLVERILPALLSMGRSGLDIKIVCPDPEGQFVRTRSNDSKMPTSNYRVVLWDYIKQVQELLQMFRNCRTELRLADGIIASSIYMGDEIALVLPYLSSGQSRETATMILTGNSEVFSIYNGEFRYMWSRSVNAEKIRGR